MPSTRVLIEHLGDADPVREGWLPGPTRGLVALDELQLTNLHLPIPPAPPTAPDFPGGTALAGPIAANTTEKAAWYIDVTGGRGGGYFYPLHRFWQQQAEEKGWVLTFSVRVDRADSDVLKTCLTVFFNNQFERMHYGVWFGSSSSGTPLVWIDGIPNKIPFHDPALSTNGYHWK